MLQGFHISTCCTYLKEPNTQTRCSEHWNLQEPDIRQSMEDSVEKTAKQHSCITSWVSIFSRSDLAWASNATNRQVPIPKAQFMNEQYIFDPLQLFIFGSKGGQGVTWNSILIGGLFHDFFSPIVDINSTSALIVASVCPGNFLILQFQKSVISSSTLITCNMVEQKNF